MLRLDGLSCGYGPFRAVNDLSLRVEEGSVYALVGANGAGKSSTLMAIAGHVDIQAGRIELDGHDITAIPIRDRVRAGIALA
ncbi:MAG TPA: ATP-binding cassette domain-containing protein, partial [Gammaproteobacteria bacterium]|nr:ATP-binding cassette domain-containing protein [Gammaproteobacteria bacterium]